MSEAARILFAAPKSGSGKTLITCGMIEICKRRGLRTASVKCGPDYIDPMFHRRVLGIPSGNLDTYFTGPDMTRYLLKKKMQGKDITILEGVMGFYDGLGGISDQASTYEAAKVTETPVIFVVDAKGASVSLAAMIRGFLEFRKDHNICGILLNRVSAGYYSRLKQLIEEECRIPVVGYLPEMKELVVPSRHLGLVGPEELPSFGTWIRQIADTMEQTVDVDQIFAIAESAETLMKDTDLAFSKKWENEQLQKLTRTVKIAVARDEAFSFYYSENLDLLMQMGAEILFVSPLRDRKLPDDIDGLILGGGYPELAAEQLEKNQTFRESLRAAVTGGLPCLAECGGFLYLQNSLEDDRKQKHVMTGVLNGQGVKTDRLQRFGYAELHCQKEGILGRTEDTIRGHEFHHWDCTENGSAFRAEKPKSRITYDCMIHTPTLAAGFPHLYYYSNPGMIYHFLKTCLDRKGVS